jgi:hypothetical protein
MRRFLLPSSLLLVLLVSTPSRSIATDYGYITARNTANEVSTSEPVGRTFHLDYTPAIWVNPFDIVIYEFYRLNTVTGARIVVDVTTAPQTDWASTNPGTYEFYVDCYDMFGDLIDCSGTNCNLTARPPARCRMSAFSGAGPAIFTVNIEDATAKPIGESFQFSRSLQYSWYSELALVPPGVSPWTAVSSQDITRTGSTLSTTSVNRSAYMALAMFELPPGAVLDEGLRWRVVIYYFEGDNTATATQIAVEIFIDVNVRIHNFGNTEVDPGEELA